MTTHHNHDFGSALKTARKLAHQTQESFDLISSRTYISSIERGLKVPTISKVDELAEVLGMHPLTLLTLAYCSAPTPASVQAVLDVVRSDLLRLLE